MNICLIFLVLFLYLLLLSFFAYTIKKILRILKNTVNYCELELSQFFTVFQYSTGLFFYSEVADHKCQHLAAASNKNRSLFIRSKQMCPSVVKSILAEDKSFFFILDNKCFCVEPITSLIKKQLWYLVKNRNVLARHLSGHVRFVLYPSSTFSICSTLCLMSYIAPLNNV
ncbi:hypothetical protein BDA99DRAFT_532187 [Phascolomyces articulosus]|uniref:Uncharacterized protein n=1 Tax=Phascolomyces articulosus TaxID=60185 RepID=A0AAD5PK00_9FUNG|nr:hypothetical protein BDA99DRAFT_532187 [Phascolomyces articulosus]